MKSGWYYGIYQAVKPLKGQRQQLIMGYEQGKRGGDWEIFMGIFPSQCTWKSMRRSLVWAIPTSTNKKSSTLSISLALEALKEIEEEIQATSPYFRNTIYIDGMDYRRLHAYSRILTKEKYGYKKSSVKSEWCELPKLYKKI